MEKNWKKKIEEKKNYKRRIINILKSLHRCTVSFISLVRTLIISNSERMCMNGQSVYDWRRKSDLTSFRRQATKRDRHWFGTLVLQKNYVWWMELRNARIDSPFSSSKGKCHHMWRVWKIEMFKNHMQSPTTTFKSQAEYSIYPCWLLMCAHI